MNFRVAGRPACARSVLGSVVGLALKLSSAGVSGLAPNRKQREGRQPEPQRVEREPPSTYLPRQHSQGVVLLLFHAGRGPHRDRHLGADGVAATVPPAATVYLGSTAVLFVVLAIEPVAGFVGYVGAHAAEYLLVVRWRIRGAGAKSAAGRRRRRAGPAHRHRRVDRPVRDRSSRPDRRSAQSRRQSGGRRDHTDTRALHLAFDSVIWRSPRSSS